MPRRKKNASPSQSYTKKRKKSLSRSKNPILQAERMKNKVPDIKDITERLTNSKIYCRDEQKSEILAFIQEKSTKKRTLFISGQPGTGKTSLLNEIFRENEEKKEEQSFLKFAINCLAIVNTEDFYDSVIKYLQSDEVKNFLNKKIENKGLENILKILESPTKSENKGEASLMKIFNIFKEAKTEFSFIILLDEVDFLYKRNNDLLFFNLISIPYLVDSNVKMILISNNSDFDNEIFPKFKNRGVELQKMVFRPYTHKELNSIMLSKLDEIGLKNFFTADAVKYLSMKLNKTGDIRPILSVIKNLILENKEKLEKGETFLVELKDIFLITQKKNITLNEIFNAMTIEQKIVVASIYFVSRATGIKLEEKAVFDKYKFIKKSTNSPLLCTEEFRDVLKSFIDVGLIENNSSLGRGKKSKSSNIYKVKYTDDELEVIFSDPMIFTLFNNQEEEDQKYNDDN